MGSEVPKCPWCGSVGISIPGNQYSYEWESWGDGIITKRAGLCYERELAALRAEIARERRRTSFVVEI